MFIAALFAVAKTWRQPVSFDGGLDKKDVVHIYNGILLTAGGNEDWKIVWCFLKKLRIELSYDPVIPLLGIYLKKT